MLILSYVAFCNGIDTNRRMFDCFVIQTANTKIATRVTTSRLMMTISRERENDEKRSSSHFPISFTFFALWFYTVSVVKLRNRRMKKVKKNHKHTHEIYIKFFFLFRVLTIDIEIWFPSAFIFICCCFSRTLFCFICFMFHFLQFSFLFRVFRIVYSFVRQFFSLFSLRPLLSISLSRAYMIVLSRYIKYVFISIYWQICTLNESKRA